MNVNLTRHTQKSLSIRIGQCLGLVTTWHVVLCFISRRRKFCQILLKLIWNRWQWPLRFSCKSLCFYLCLFLSLSPFSHTLSFSFLTKFLFSITSIPLFHYLPHTLSFSFLSSHTLLSHGLHFLHISHLVFVVGSLFLFNNFLSFLKCKIYFTMK